MRSSLILTLLLLAASAFAEETIPADGISWDPPTLFCIGVRWFVVETQHPEASVAVAYRQKGQTDWRTAMPLRRVETAAMQERRPAEGTSLYAGSIFNLTPDTEYEVRLTLKDKSGATVEKTATLRTWKEPVAPAPKRTLHVAPGDKGGTGTAGDPFRGLASANAAAQPGDLFLVHAGVYPGRADFARGGTQDAPMVWRAAGDGDAVIEGPAEGAAASCAQAHVFFERLVFRKARFGLVLHNAKNITVRRCRFLEVGTGITADRQQERFFIADSVFVGPRAWPPDKNGEPEHRGIELSGVGHVVAWNRVSHFRDGIDTRPDYPVRGIDICYNDVSESQDDGTELDYSESNCRAYCNRYTNVNLGISFQPSRGGPNYAVRNTLVNVLHESFKLHLSPAKPGHMTSGGVILNNTVVKNGPAFRVWSDEGPANFFYARNNLYVTRNASGAVEITCPMNDADFDYDLFAGGPFKVFASWNRTRYATIDDFRKIGQEEHGRVVNGTEGIFASRDMAPPADKDAPVENTKNDPQLVPGSPAADAGEAIPNVTDGFRGAAPDCGALELGDPLPHYGPRP